MAGNGSCSSATPSRSRRTKMALTQLQASDQYIMDSLAMFLDRRVKTFYDTQAALTVGKPDAYERAMKIRMGSPDDPAVGIYTPEVALDFQESSGKNDFFGIGDSAKWRHFSIAWYCYPAQNDDGAPSRGAQMLLTTAIKNAIGTETIRILDYSNPSFSPSNILYCRDVMYVVGHTDPMPRGQKVSQAVMRHRFDVHMSLKVAVTEAVVD